MIKNKGPIYVKNLLLILFARQYRNNIIITKTWILKNQNHTVICTFDTQ